MYDITTNLTVPAPWASGTCRLIETIHLLRNNYKFKETVSFPGARHLYLKFDPRCSSQYDYDKVSLNHTYFLSLVPIFGFVFYLTLHESVYVSLPFSLYLFPSFPLSLPLFSFPSPPLPLSVNYYRLIY